MCAGGGVALARIGPMRPHPVRQPRLALGCRDAGTQPRDERKRLRPLRSKEPVALEDDVVHRKRRPEIEGHVAEAAESLRGDANDLQRMAAHANGLADDRRVATEPASPRIVAQHDNRLRTASRGVRCDERPT